VTPDDPGALQTLASVRLSQDRRDDAVAALSRSLHLWKDLDPEDAKVPDFPTRISLSRLLMEAQMESEALEVLERLVAEDDSSVEAWYLGGWCQHLLAEKMKPKSDGQYAVAELQSYHSMLRSSADWLQRCLQLYQMVEYEDVRLKEHATALMSAMSESVVIGKDEQATHSDDSAAWEDEDDDGDDPDSSMSCT
jgi:predicted Zn-dependent protease